MAGITSLDEAYEMAEIPGSILIETDLRAMVDTFLRSSRHKSLRAITTAATQQQQQHGWLR
jgi:hypothetical protein